MMGVSSFDGRVKALLVQAVDDKARQRRPEAQRIAAVSTRHRPRQGEKQIDCLRGGELQGRNFANLQLAIEGQPEPDRGRLRDGDQQRIGGHLPDAVAQLIDAISAAAP